MRSVTTKRFRKAFQSLPEEVQLRAKLIYQVWAENHDHPSLHFSRVHPSQPVYSVRIGLHWRALAVVEDNVAVWVWIGSHSDYDQLLDSL